MGRRLHALTITSIACLAACNAIIGLSGDYDVGGGGDGGSVDGNTGHEDALAPDGTTPGTDGETPDNDAGTDATIDTFVPDAPYDALYPTAWDLDASARDATIGPSAHYCDGIGLSQWFCWDFTGDDGIQVDGVGGSHWTTGSMSGGAITLIGDSGEPNHAARASVDNDGVVGPVVELTRNLAAPPSGTTELLISFTFHVPETATSTRLVTVTTFTGTEYGLELFGGNSCFGAPCLGEIGPDKPIVVNANADPFDVNQWYRGAIDLKRDTAGNWGATITIGGHVVAQRTSGAFPTSLSAIPAMVLTIGTFEAQPPLGKSTLEIDDILFQVH